MALYRDTGVVLRVQKLGEADRIVTILTRRHGKVRAVAKGVRRTRSRWGARLEPFNHVDVQCYTGRSLDIVTQAETVDAFGAGLVGDYGRYTAGCAVLETADRLVADRVDDRGHDALADLALLELGEEPVTDLGLGLRATHGGEHANVVGLLSLTVRLDPHHHRHATPPLRRRRQRRALRGREQQPHRRARGRDIAVSYLPYAHIAERVLGIYIPRSTAPTST